MNKALLYEYAKLIAKKGVNVQAGEIVVVKGPVEAYPFVRMVVEALYKEGAGEVLVDYIDNINNRYDYLYQDIETLKEVPDYIIDRAKYLVGKKYSSVSITAPDLDALVGIDQNKVITKRKASMVLKFASDYLMNNDGKWCVAAASTKTWANKVFKDDPNAEDKLWDAIFKACHVDEFNTIENWTKNSDTITSHAKILNDYDFLKLHFKNSIGTDLEVYLAEDNIFCGGDEYSNSGCRFSPNIPTEEVFGMPYKTKVNGTVRSTKPLNYQGTLIEDFTLTFKDGKVVDYKAKSGEDLLKFMLEFDEGSSYLGEVALISYNSPISNMNILFYNTLFDENASCHLALGQAYPSNIKGGTKMTKEELAQKGANESTIHVDFMFGSSDMKIVGTTKTGKEIVIFENGNFII